MSKEDKSKIYLNNILERTPAYIFWKDINLIYLGCNYKFANLLGKNFPKEIIGKTDFELGWGTGEAENFRKRDIDVINGNPIVNVEEEVIRPDGSKFMMLVNKTPLRDQYDNCIGILGISVDITERKLAEDALKIAKEAAEAANHAKTQFVQNMQHDIRTPAAGIFGLLNSLSQSESDPERKNLLNMATESSKRLLNLCNEAVEFGDLEGNSKPIIEHKVDPREMAKEVIELNFPAAFSKNITLKFKASSSLPSYVIIDKFRLNRILINLLGNAVKFTDKGEVSLHLRYEQNAHTHKDLLILEVKDTGIGIAGDKIDAVFQKFSRGVESNTNKYPGTGLGLYVVKTFVDELEGDIEIESHFGEGTTFTLALPFKAPVRNEGEPGIEINAIYESPFKNKKIPKVNRHKNKQEDKNIENTPSPFSHKVLIIEDDALCLFGEKRLALSFTPNIDTATNVKEALEQLSKHHYDLIVSDLGLPDGSGTDIASLITKSPDALNKNTPFVAMTAHQNKEKHQEAMAAGFVEVETKPLTEKVMEYFFKKYPLPSQETNTDKKNACVPKIIDINATMKILKLKTEGEAIETIAILAETLKVDIKNLKKYQKENNVLGIRDILHKIEGGLRYCSAPYLEKVVIDLHVSVKKTSDLNSLNKKFNLVYEEVKNFKKTFESLRKS